jgi:hypothetical protein
LEIFADGLAIEIRRDDRVLYDSSLEGTGFEPSVPRATVRGASRNSRLPASVEMVEPLRRARPGYGSTVRWKPYGSLNLARIDMNGSYIGAVENGNAFYRDVPPRHYHIAPESFGRDFNQDKDVDLAAGQQLYVKIVSLESWGVSVSGSKNIERDAFYAWLISPEVAQAEIARERGGI